MYDCFICGNNVHHGEHTCTGCKQHSFFFSISEIWPEAAMLRKELQTRHSISEADVLHTEGLHIFFSTANNGQGLRLLECRMYFTLSLDNLISQWIHWSHKLTNLTCEECVPGFNFYLSILLSHPHLQCYLEKLLACTRIARINQQMSLDSLPYFTKCFHFNMVASPDVFINA